MNLSDFAPGLLANREETLEAFVPAALARLLRGAQAVGARAEDAEDIALDVIFVTLTKLSSLDLSNASENVDPLGAYMLRAVKRRVWEKYRASRREARSLAAAGNRPDPKQPIAVGYDTEPSALVWSAPANEAEAPSALVEHAKSWRQSLPERDQRLIDLRVETNLTFVEIAAELNMRPANARQRWGRLLAQGRAALQFEEGTGE